MSKFGKGFIIGVVTAAAAAAVAYKNRDLIKEKVDYAMENENVVHAINTVKETKTKVVTTVGNKVEELGLDETLETVKNKVGEAVEATKDTATKISRTLSQQLTKFKVQYPNVDGEVIEATMQGVTTVLDDLENDLECSLAQALVFENQEALDEFVSVANAANYHVETDGLSAKVVKNVKTSVEEIAKDILTNINSYGVNYKGWKIEKL
ncbi:MAG: hypothetical protein ACK5G7_06410 [Erysipelotrichaceae bacterium]